MNCEQFFHHEGGKRITAIFERKQIEPFFSIIIYWIDGPMLKKISKCRDENLLARVVLGEIADALECFFESIGADLLL
jgi:hypothetical protein